MIKDYDSLFERFSIMTIDGHIPDDKALEVLKKITTPELYGRLIEWLRRKYV